MGKPFAVRSKAEILTEYMCCVDVKDKIDWTDQEIFNYYVLTLLADIRRQLGKLITEAKKGGRG